MKRLLLFGSTLTAALACASLATAQPYPNKLVRIVIGFTAGGPADFIARTIAQKMSEQLGQTVVVDNRAGANGLLAADIVLKAPPDGYTVFMSSSGLLAFSTHLYPDQQLDPIKEFIPITVAVGVPEFLVTTPALPVRSVKELVALGKARPGQLNFASSGAGGLPHLAMESFCAATGIKAIHVPYKGAAQAVTDVMGGHVQMTFLDVPVLAAQIRAGKLRALTIATEKRSSLFPDVPTTAEVGYPSVTADNWYAAMFSNATPKDVATRMNGVMVKAIHAPDVRERFSSQGINAIGNSPEEFAAFWRAEYEKWGRFIKAAKIKVE